MTYTLEFIIGVGCQCSVLIGFGFHSAAAVGAGHGRTIQIGRRQGASELVEVAVDRRSSFHIHIVCGVDKPAFIGNIHAVAVADRYLTGAQRQRAAAENTAFRRGGLTVTGAVVGIDSHGPIRVFLTGRPDVVGAIRISTAVQHRILRIAPRRRIKSAQART